MDNNFQKIKELVLQSELSFPDKEELLLAFMRVNSDEDLIDVLELFNEDPTWIPKISANLKAKNVVAMTGDAVLWDEVLEKQMAELKELSE